MPLDCCRSLKTVDQLLQSNNLVSKTRYVIIMGVKEGAFRTCLTYIQTYRVTHEKQIFPSINKKHQLVEARVEDCFKQ